MEAFERCLRDLQHLLKELRQLQVAAHTPPGEGDQTKKNRKRSGPKQFLSLQRKLFQKLSKLRAILFRELAHCGSQTKRNTSTDGPSSFAGKKGALAKLQAPCEKLLRGLLERLGSAASHDGFTLTPAVYASVGDCLELVYRHGSQRTLLESMAKWEQSLMDKQTTPTARIAMFHCAEAMFVAQERRLASYLGTFVACAAKQFKIMRGATHGNDVTTANVRAAGIRCVGRAVHAVGNAAISEHTAVLKLCKLGCQDKSGVVRQVVAGLLLALGQSAADWANFSADTSVTVDALLAVGSKAMDDGNEGNQHVQLAFVYIKYIYVVHVVWYTSMYR